MERKRGLPRRSPGWVTFNRLSWTESKHRALVYWTAERCIVNLSGRMQRCLSASSHSISSSSSQKRLQRLQSFHLGFDKTELASYKTDYDDNTNHFSCVHNGDAFHSNGIDRRRLAPCRRCPGTLPVLLSSVLLSSILCPPILGSMSFLRIGNARPLKVGAAAAVAAKTQHKQLISAGNCTKTFRNWKISLRPGLL